MIWWLLLVALPCVAEDLFLTPSSFTVSPGERMTFAIEGAAWTVGQIEDPVLVAAIGVYNLTNLRVVDGVLMLDGTAKSKGSLIAAVHSAHRQQQYFAKALLTCDAPGDTARKIVGHTLEIVPESMPSDGGVSMQVLLRGKPSAGVRVEILSNGSARKNVGVTGADGNLSLQISELGVYRIMAVHETMRASLTFEMK